MPKETSLSLSIFGRWVAKKNLAELQQTLLRANIPTPPQVYYANALTILAGGIASMIVLGVVLGLLFGFMWTIVLTLLGIIIGPGGYVLYLRYPSSVAGGRATTIDITLPHAITFLYATTSGGSSILDAFKELAEQREEYGEISKEAAKIVRAVNYMGLDISGAITEISKNTPSRKFMNFLDTLVTIIKTGGNITDYLGAKSSEYRKEAAQVQKSSLEMLAFFAEFYMIVFVLMPLLLLIMFQIFSMTGGSYLLMAYAIIFFYIPFGSIIGIFMLNVLIKGLGIRKIKHDEPKLKGSQGLSELFRSNPLNLMMISAPVGIITGVVLLLLRQEIMGALAISCVVTIIPPAVLHEKQLMSVSRYEKRVPDFLKGLSNALKAGLQLPLAMETLKSAPMGGLTGPVKEMIKTLKLGGSTREALRRFASTTKSGLVYRVTTLIERSVESGGDTSKVVDIAEEDIIMVQSLERERSGVMITYLAIIYIAFGVFIFIAFALSGSMLTGGMMEGQGTQFGGLTFTLGAGVVRAQWFAACVMQSLFSGLIAGKISTGRVMDGLKHSAIMLIVTYLCFTLFIV